MKILAINEKETLRVVKFGDEYHLQKPAISVWLKPTCWVDNEIAGEEWVASKWILDYGLKVSTDYPTIAEIREQQKKDKVI